MNTSVDRSELVAALKALSGVISRRTAHPAVGQVEISHHPMKRACELWLTMTDFQVTATISVLIHEHPAEFRAIVNAERLTRFLSQDPADEVTLSLDGGRGDLVVTGRSTAKLACLPANDYPQNPVPPTEGWEALPLDTLSLALQRVSWAAGTGKLRSPSTLCLRSPGEALVDVYAMRDGRVLAGVQGFCASLLDPEGRFPAGIGVSPAVADFLAGRRCDPGSPVEVAIEPGRRIWWRGPGFQVAEQWPEDQVHPDYGKVFLAGQKAPLVVTLSPDQAEELVSGLHTLSGLGSWGLGTAERATDVVSIAVDPDAGIEAYVWTDVTRGSFVLECPVEGKLAWKTSFPGELISALKMLSGGGDIEVRCLDGLHLFLFNERGGCCSLSGRQGGR